MWRLLGLSVDWSYLYTTIDLGEPPRPVSVPSCATSPAARPTSRRRPHSGTSTSARPWRRPSWRIGTCRAPTTRSPSTDLTATSPSTPPGPSCLAACVALVAHPDDRRYAGLFGRTVRTPLFGVEVPVHAHALAEPEKGTGIAMVCTFGDLTDVTWWRDLDLPARGHRRRRRPAPPTTGRHRRRRRAPALRPNWPARRSSKRRRRRSTYCGETGELLGDPRPITHPVKFYEKGDRPLEIVTTRQWYIRNGGRDAGLREQLLGRGRELSWHPGYMRQRYENWVGGLTGDWLDQPPAVLRRAVSRVVSARRHGEPAPRRADLCPTRRRFRSTRRPKSRPATPRINGASPTASSVTRT